MPPHPIFRAVVIVSISGTQEARRRPYEHQAHLGSDQDQLDDYAPSMGAALAYYTLFSIAPLLLIVISTAGLVFGEDAVRGEIFGQLRDLMGDQGAQAVQSLLASVSEPKKGVAGTIIGIVLLVIGATTVLGELQDAFDRIWRVPEKDKKGGVVTLIWTRLLSLGIILGIGFLLIVSLVFSAAMAALGKWWGPFFSNLEILATVVNFFFSFMFLSSYSQCFTN